MTDVTRLLDAAATGDCRAAAELLPHLYIELRKLATARLADEKPGQTFDATSLVHEAYLRRVDAERALNGPVAATPLPPRPRPCAASWSNGRDASSD
jgi:hypothetical protein